MRDRFGATYRLDFYADDELTAIVERSAGILGVPIEPRPSRAIARRGRGTPRIVNRLLKRVRDHAEVHGDGRVDEATATAAMRPMEIDDEGLDSDGSQAPRRDRPEVRVRAGRGGGAGRRPVRGDRDTIEDVYEPFLLRLGFLDRTPQGRIATDLARAHLSGLGYEIPPPRRADPDMPSGCGTSRRHRRPT